MNSKLLLLVIFVTSLCPLILCAPIFDIHSKYVQETLFSNSTCGASSHTNITMYYRVNKCMPFSGEQRFLTFQTYSYRFYQTDIRKGMIFHCNDTHFIRDIYNDYDCLPIQFSHSIITTIDTPTTCHPPQHSMDSYKHIKCVNTLNFNENSDHTSLYASWIKYNVFFDSTSLKKRYVTEYHKGNVGVGGYPLSAGTEFDYTARFANFSDIFTFFYDYKFSDWFVLSRININDGEWFRISPDFQLKKRVLHNDDLSEIYDVLQKKEDVGLQKYVIQTLYYKSNCKGTYALKVVTPNDKCLSYYKNYQNSEFSLQIEYAAAGFESGVCSAAKDSADLSNITRIGYMTKENYAYDYNVNCDYNILNHVFPNLYVKETYSDVLPDDLMSVNLDVNCDADNIDIHEIKRNPSFYNFFMDVDYCIEENKHTATSFLGLDDGAMRGKCAMNSGNLVVFNYTNSDQCVGYYEKLRPTEKFICNGNKLYSCVEFVCYGVSQYEIGKVCSGHGECVDYDECDCFEGYEGDTCEIDVNKAMRDVLTLVIVGSLSVIVICFVTVLVFIFVLSFGAYYYFKQRKRIKKIKEIGDSELDMMIDEKKALKRINSNSKLLPNFKINFSKLMFLINENDVKYLKFLDQGASGSCFLGEYQGKHVVVKSVPVDPNDLEFKSSLKEFENEVGLLLSLKSPLIVECYGVIFKDSSIGYVMEYCERGNLKAFLKSYNEKNKSKYPFNEKLRMVLEICQGMKFIHSRDIIHRDLKPHNVFVDDELEVKIGDFGLSRLTQTGNKTLTRKIGTGKYMSPEMALGLEYDSSTDVFSFGIMLFEIFAERDAYEFDNFGRKKSKKEEINVEMRVANQIYYRPPIDDEMDMPDYIKVLAKECWSREKEKRKTFEQIIKYLKESKQIVIYLKEGNSKNDEGAEDVLLKEISIKEIEKAVKEKWKEKFEKNENLSFECKLKNGLKPLKRDEDVIAMMEDSVIEVYFAEDKKKEKE